MTLEKYIMSDICFSTDKNPTFSKFRQEKLIRYILRLRLHPMVGFKKIKNKLHRTDRNTVFTS